MGPKRDPEGDTEFAQVRIPKDLTSRIDRLIDEGGLGYSSRTSVVLEAVREFLQRQDEAQMRREGFDDFIRNRKQETVPRKLDRSRQA